MFPAFFLSDGGNGKTRAKKLNGVVGGGTDYANMTSQALGGGGMVAGRLVNARTNNMFPKNPEERTNSLRFFAHRVTSPRSELFKSSAR